jgi:hypothetical protein
VLLGGWRREDGDGVGGNNGYGQSEAHDALAGVTRMRRALRDHGHLLAFGLYGAVILRRFAATLSKDWLAALGSEEAEVAVRHLGELHRLLSQVISLGEDQGLTRQWPYKYYFAEYADVNDRVDDVLENLHLALNEDFRRLVGRCADQLKDRPRRDWRSSLAAMRD